MSDILSIGASAAQLYRQSLSTVSNNIANLNTEGYSRQEATSVEGMPSQQGTVFLGTGANLQGISRSYDEFIENSLRNSTSDLATQQPVIKYAERIVDVMGSETSGLTSAFDRFFAAASSLSADPASSVTRGVFVRDAEALASRFRELSGALDTIDNEVRNEISQEIKSLNTLTQQLAVINGQLGEKISLDKQPARLLDQRDMVLRDLANIAKIHVTEKPSGEVSVRLGSSAGSLLVEKKASVDLSVRFDNTDPGRVDIVLDPYGDAYASSTISSGKLGGLINFRSQTLGPVLDGFDFLAQKLVSEVNQIHRSGMDSRGDRGKDLFGIQPTFSVDGSTLSSQVNVSVDLQDPASFEYSPFSLTWIDAENSWRVTSQQTGDVSKIKNDLLGISYAGLNIKIQGEMKDGDTLQITPETRPAAGVFLKETDPMAIAAARRLSVTSSSENMGDAEANLSISDTVNRQQFEYGTNILSLGNNISPSASISVDPNSLEPSFVIPKGTSDATLMMEVPQGSNLQFQVMTSEGVHVLGHEVDQSTQTALMAKDAGFNKDAKYSDSYLNAELEVSYKGIELTYGLLAKSSEITSWVPNEDGTGMNSRVESVNALVQSQPVQYFENTTTQTIKLIDDNSLLLNGYSLPALTIDAGQDSDAAMMSAWLNSHSEDTGVTASAVNEIRVAGDEIDFYQQLEINGVLVQGTHNSADGLSDAINALSASTNVVSYVSREGGLVVTNAEGFSGEAIRLGNPDSTQSSNALGVVNTTFSGALELTSADKVRFTFGDAGRPSDLSVLGLRTGVYVTGAVDEDLAVYVTGSESANVSVGFGEPADLESQQVESAFGLKFVSDTEYQIIDKDSETILATRQFDGVSNIKYGSAVISFAGPPAAGDVFSVSSNVGGVGDNGTMLEIVDLQTKQFLPGDRSLTDSFIDLVGDVGNKATLSKISQEALQVVQEQAAEARDRVSGVSLDQEAADLIRFQQAYQASAQIIQMSSKIFDSILAIR